MPLLGQVQVPDYQACAIRLAAQFAGTDEHVAMAIAMTESDFDAAAEGDEAFGPDVTVNGVVYHPYQDPQSGRFYCSLGLFQLNMCGGQGAGHTAAELFDAKSNSDIAIRAIALAVMQYAHTGLPFERYVREVARHSGHPGYVALDDQRLVDISNNALRLVFNGAGQLSPWPPNNPAVCAGGLNAPPPLGTWAEPLNPATKDQAQTVIEAHFERVNQLFLDF